MPAEDIRRALLLCALAALVFAVFALWPGLDIRVTALFFDPQARFAAADDGALNQLRLAVWRLSELLLLVAVLASVVGLFTRSDVLRVPRRVWLYIATLYLLAPGILVDVVIKRVWGRARPADVTEFGGNLQFTPPHEISGQCARNCSFVAGEVSGAVALAVSLFLLLGLFRSRMGDGAYRTAQAAILAIPLFVAFQRIAAGRHFLSDAVLATILVLLVAVLLKPLLRRPRTP